jgi:purine-binding chemotaxis protein CheW
MPRLRRKTPHEPVRAIPAPVERGPSALPPRTRPKSLRDIVIELNAGKPRDRGDVIDMPAFDDLLAPAPVIPLRDRLASGDGNAELLVFQVCGELFAMELRAVEEAVEGVDARAIPDAPPAMLGILALRDRTLPMYSLARVLELDRQCAPHMTLVMRPANARIAVAVDAVDDVFDAPLSGVRPAPAGDTDGVVLGVVWRGAELVTLLDAEIVVNTCLVAAPPDSL